MNNLNKPPLGVVTKYIWQAERLHEIDCAIINRIDEGNIKWEVPIEWINERNELLMALKKENRNDSTN